MNTSEATKNSRSDQPRWKSVSRVLHRSNHLNTTSMRNTLRANNRALAQALSKKKAELSKLMESYVKLQAENQFLRLNVSKSNVDLSCLYENKFTGVKDMVTDAVLKLHGVCKQLLSISADQDIYNTNSELRRWQSTFNSGSRFNGGLLQHNTSTINSSRPAQRVLKNPEPEEEEEEGKDDTMVDKPIIGKKDLSIIDEACTVNASTIEMNCDDSTAVEESIEIQSRIIEDENNKTEPLLEVSMTEECNAAQTSLAWSDQHHVEESISELAEERCLYSTKSEVVNKPLGRNRRTGSHGKEKVHTLKKKAPYINKPGCMKYNAAKLSSEGSEKLKYKSLYSTVSVQRSSSLGNDAGKENSASQICSSPKTSHGDKSPMKERQLSVYDISLDDSNSICKKNPKTRKRNLSKDDSCIEAEGHRANKQRKRHTSEVPTKKYGSSDDNDVSKHASGSQGHGIMLRLGSGVRTKPKNRNKSVRYGDDDDNDDSDETRVPSTDEIVLRSPQLQELFPEQSVKQLDEHLNSFSDELIDKVNKQYLQITDQIASDLQNDVILPPCGETDLSASGHRLMEDTENDGGSKEAKLMKEKTSLNNHLEQESEGEYGDFKDVRKESVDSVDSRLSQASDIGRRKRNTNVNYREPSLNQKLRRGDPHTSTIYDRSRKGKKSRKKSDQSEEDIVKQLLE